MASLQGFEYVVDFTVFYNDFPTCYYWYYLKRPQISKKSHIFWNFVAFSENIDFNHNFDIFLQSLQLMILLKNTITRRWKMLKKVLLSYLLKNGGAFFPHPANACSAGPEWYRCYQAGYLLYRIPISRIIKGLDFDAF